MVEPLVPPVLHHQDSGGRLHRAQAVGDDDGIGLVQDKELSKNYFWTVPKQAMAPVKALAMARRCHCPPERSAPFSFIFPGGVSVPRGSSSITWSRPIAVASTCRDGRMMECAVRHRLFQFILPNDFTCHETRLHNADWFNRMITLGSIQRYAV